MCEDNHTNTGSIILHLNGHCIKTAAHREFSRLIDLYMALPADADDKGMAFKIETLRLFLENADFPSLRANDERLTGISEVWVRMRWDDELTLEISEEPFER